MKIVVARPPNFEKILAAFPEAQGKGVIFAWGDTIYNPSGQYLPNYLLGHEAVHGERQGTNVEGWWDRYIADPEYRLAEELPAHLAEYRIATEQVKDRNLRNALLHQVATKLASPLYGGVITYLEARRRLAQ